MALSDSLLASRKRNSRRSYYEPKYGESPYTESQMTAPTFGGGNVNKAPEPDPMTNPSAQDQAMVDPKDFSFLPKWELPGEQSKGLGKPIDLADTLAKGRMPEVVNQPRTTYSDKPQGITQTWLGDENMIRDSINSNLQPSMPGVRMPSDYNFSTGPIPTNKPGITGGGSGDPTRYDPEYVNSADNMVQVAKGLGDDITFDLRKGQITDVNGQQNLINDKSFDSGAMGKGLDQSSAGGLADSLLSSVGGFLQGGGLGYNPGDRTIAKQGSIVLIDGDQVENTPLAINQYFTKKLGRIPNYTTDSVGRISY